MIRRVFCTFLATTILLTSIPVFSKTIKTYFGTTVDGVRIISEQIIEYSDFGFSIIEKIDENHRIIRVIERNDALHTQFSSDIYTKATTILTLLGISSFSIERMAYEQLEFIALSPNIQGIISYSRVDELGYVTYIEPSVAYFEAERAIKEELAEIELLAHMARYNLFEYESIQHNSGGAGIKNDGIMRLMHVVTQNHLDRERYRFVTKAEWLQMPFARRVDSIGSIATSIAIDFDSISSFYGFDRRTQIGDTFSWHSHTYIPTSQHRINGSWQGIAAILNMPSDVTMVYPVFISHRHTNFYAFNIFDGLIVHPQLATNFNSVGSHYHNGFGIGQFNPSVSITLRGISASIGLDPSLQNTTRRDVSLLLQYTP